MIGANGAAASDLDRKGFPSLRRVLRAPERWDRIVALASDTGTRLPATPDARALEGFLAQRRQVDPERFGDLSLAVVKLLGSGEYVLELPGQGVAGHFGLAVKGYSHSTAPNRRYPDLTTQRLLKAALAGRPAPQDTAELSALARHCTEQEDDAAKVERQVRKSAAALLLSSRVGERFDGVVTGASEKGTWVRVRRPTVEGKLVRGFAGLDVGDRVEVVLINTDVEHGFIDFARAGR
jgi:exoribonuclease-2